MEDYAIDFDELLDEEFGKDAGAPNEDFEAKEEKRYAITFSEKMRREFEYEGKPLSAVKVPNADLDDKSPWAEFVISSKMVHKSKYKDGQLFVYLPESETLTLKKSVAKADPETGEKAYEELPPEKVTAKELYERIAASRRAYRQDRAEGEPDAKKAGGAEYVRIGFSKKCVREFESKDGRKLASISVPPAPNDEEGKWQSFVVPADAVKESKFDERKAYISLPADKAVTLTSSRKETDAEGKDAYATEKQEASPAEIKARFAAGKPQQKKQKSI